MTPKIHFSDLPRVNACLCVTTIEVVTNYYRNASCCNNLVTVVNYRFLSQY